MHPKPPFGPISSESLIVYFKHEAFYIYITPGDLDCLNRD